MSGPLLIRAGVVLAAALISGPLVLAREGAVPIADACREATDPSSRIAACTAEIAATRDKSRLGRAYNRRGHAYNDLKNYLAAARDFTVVANLNPTVGGYQDNRANALRLAGRYDDALAAADTAVRLAPGYAFVLRGRALVHEDMGHLDQAMGDVDRALAIDPQNGGLHADRGRLLGRMVHDEDAIRELTKGIDLDASLDGARRERALVYARSGRRAEAIADLDVYTAKHPDDEQAVQILAVQQRLMEPGGFSPLVTDPRALDGSF